MPPRHREKLLRLSFRIDEPTKERLDKIAKLLASRDGFPVASRTQAIRFAAQIADALSDRDTFDATMQIVHKLASHDASGAPALGEAIKFAVRIAAKSIPK